MLINHCKYDKFFIHGECFLTKCVFFRGRFTSLWFLLELTNCGFHIGKVFKQMVYKIRGKHALKKSQCLQDQIFNRQTRRVFLGTLGGGVPPGSPKS